MLQKRWKNGRGKIKGFSAETVETAIKYCYDRTPYMVTVPQAALLLQFANKYEINFLKVSIRNL